MEHANKYNKKNAYICIYIYIYRHIYTYMYTYAYICIHIQTSVRCILRFYIFLILVKSVT